MPFAEPTLDARRDWLPSVLLGLYMLASSIAGFFLPVYLTEQLGFSGSGIGMIYAGQALAGALAAFPAGWSNDRITSRFLVVVSFVALAVGFVLMAWVRTFPLFLLVYTAYHLAYGLLRVSMDVQVLKTDTGENTGERVGLYQAWRFAGIGVGTFLAGYLLQSLDFRLSLLAGAALTLVLIFPALRLPPTPLQRVRLADYKADFANPRVLLFVGWLVLFATHWGAEFTCYGLFLRNELHLSLIGMGWYLSAEFVFIVVTVLIVGRSMKKPSRMFQLTWVGLLLSGIGQLGMVLHPVGVSFAFRAVHAVGDGMIFLVLYVGIVRLFDVGRLGGNSGLIQLTTLVGMIVGSLISGPIGARFGYAWPLAVTGALTIALITPLFHPTLRKQMV